jgi:tungstate transport system substrate-binding protein
MKPLRLLSALLVLAAAAPALSEPPAARRDLVLATTTSVRDSGLLDELLPLFEGRSGTKVRAVAVGSGAALRMGADGNADLLLTHAPEGEQELLRQGKVATRTPFMENHFVIAGPPEDPAGVAKAATPAEAFRGIAALPARYVSRADDSGTHRRERALLAAADLDPEGGWKGFAKTGSGMGLTLQVAGQRRAYVLSDLGTFLAFRERTGLTALSKPDPQLRNVYSVLVVRNNAEPLARFFLEEQTQRRIAGFGRKRFGQPLFRPLLLERP